MVLEQSRLVVADNSGAKEVGLIRNIHFLQILNFHL